ncbi:MAG TPA: acyl-CoA thioesterase [Usitatibacter sp.]|nr:acyl-CoA thioesterase [Usitatibacter sp.]
MASLPEREQPVLRIVPMPADTNAHGTIFGGWVMSQVDVAGSIPAWERAHGRIVTVAVNSFVFREPVFVGDVVSFYARVLKVGRTSITVDVEVFAERRREGRKQVVRVTEAQLTYVAVDDQRRPRVVPPGDGLVEV